MKYSWFKHRRIRCLVAFFRKVIECGALELQFQVTWVWVTLGFITKTPHNRWFNRWCKDTVWMLLLFYLLSAVVYFCFDFLLAIITDNEYYWEVWSAQLNGLNHLGDGRFFLRADGRRLFPQGIFTTFIRFLSVC